MNDTEKALRKCMSGAPKIAVIILDSWTDENRIEFRDAFLREDWETVYRLCAVASMSGRPPSRVVFLHLMDATAEELPSQKAIDLITMPNRAT